VEEVFRFRHRCYVEEYRIMPSYVILRSTEIVVWKVRKDISRTIKREAFRKYYKFEKFLQTCGLEN
jgi:hypothetical protein